jgi:4-hydroxy-tetrahydrodipicolinate synthase
MQNINQTYLWTALITPFDHNGEVDFFSLTHLLKKQDEAGNGILLLGSTGEALSLTLAEKNSIIELAISLNLNSPLMVGVGGIDLNEQMEWIKQNNSKSIDAFLLVTPLYAKPGRYGQTEWFQQLLDSSEKPCMLYNVPSRTGIKLNFDTVGDLANHKNFWALKEASGSTEDFARYKSLLPNQKVMSGDDELLPDFVPLGCEGLVSVISNAWPKETNMFTDYCLKQNFEPVTKVWPHVARTAFIAANPIPIKAMAEYLGLIRSAITRPPLSCKDLERVGPLIEANNLVKNWYQKQINANTLGGSHV